MKNQTETKTLEQVLFEFMTENEAPSREALTEWIRRYPQYEQDLVDLTVDWFELSLPLTNGTSIEGEAVVVQNGVDFVRDFLHKEQMRLQENPKAHKSFLGFIREGMALNISLDKLAERVGLTPALLAKIDRRIVRYASLPLDLIQALAESVNWDLLSGVQYLQVQPTIPSGQRFKSSEVPQIAEQTDFFDEIRADPDLSEAQRLRWLAIEPKK